jgi:uncharacterized protein (DUF305 family)
MRAFKTLFLVPLLLVLSACSGQGSNPTISQENTLSANDVMFAQMMIPHHQQAVEMAELVADRSDNPEIQALALEIIAAQDPEIALMQGWIDEFGDSGMDHGGHSMGGMLTEAELEELRAATGREFEKLFLEGMIRHHEGAIDMAAMLTNSNYPAAQKLRADIIETQTAEIERMKKLLEAY